MSTQEHVDASSTQRGPSTRRTSSPRKVRAWTRSVFPLIIFSLLGAGMVGQLALQTQIQEQGFELGELQATVEKLDARQTMLQAALDKKSTPQQLAFAASQLGMVANPYSTFLSLPTGEISGMNLAVGGNEVPIISAPPVLVQPDPGEDVVAQASQPEADGENGGLA